MGAYIRMAAVALVLLASPSRAPPPPSSAHGPNATITETVVERVDEAPCSFLRLETDEGQVWVGVPMAEAPK